MFDMLNIRTTMSQLASQTSRRTQSLCSSNGDGTGPAESAPCDGTDTADHRGVRRVSSSSRRGRSRSCTASCWPSAPVDHPTGADGEGRDLPDDGCNALYARAHRGVSGPRGAPGVSPPASTSYGRSDRTREYLAGAVLARPDALGTLLTTATAILVAALFGVAGALFISDIAPEWLREIVKLAIELLAGIPSIVYGFIGFTIINPYVGNLLSINPGALFPSVS